MFRIFSAITPHCATVASKRFQLALGFVVAALHVAPLFAQTGGKMPDFYKEPGLYPNRDYTNQHFGEHVDPFTGALQLHYTDVFIPGNGGFNLAGRCQE